MDMKRILQTLDSASSKPVVGADSMARFLRVVKEAEINQPTAPVPPTAPTAAAEEPMQSPEQIKYNQLRGQWDSYQSLTADNGTNTFVSKDPVHDAKLQTIPAQLARMAAALKAKGIDAEADYAAIGGGLKSAPVDINQLYKDDEPAVATTGAPAPVGESIDKFLSIIKKNDVSILNESKGPHKVTLPVQMAMQHYQTEQVAERKPRIIDKYFQEAEQAITQRKEEKRELINQYAKVIAERVLMKENAVSEHEAGFERHGMAGVGIQSSVAETPIDMSGDPNDPHIYGHEKANPMSLKGRIQQARTQLKELAELAESDELLIWERITRLSKGGMFMGLEQNLEQIRHGISELAAKRKRGGVASRGIDKNIG